MSSAFRNPPINELVIGTYFTPPLADMRSEHIGLFWQAIRAAFPVVRQNLPLGVGPNVPVDEVFPMPRYWFVSEDDTRLIQLQRDAFIFNWRRRHDEYPRFHKDIKPMFDRCYGLFEEFVRTEIGVSDLHIGVCELNYVNVLEQSKLWAGPEDTTRIMPSFSLPVLGVEGDSYPDFNCDYAYGVSPDLQLNIRARSTFKDSKKTVRMLIFEIRASGRFDQAGKLAADEWFERAHDKLNECFRGVTSPDVQNEVWQPVGEKS